jgi:hypothetical protein
VAAGELLMCDSGWLEYSVQARSLKSSLHKTALRKLTNDLEGPLLVYSISAYRRWRGAVGAARRVNLLMFDSGWLGYSVQARSLKCLCIQQPTLKMGRTNTTYHKDLFQSLHLAHKYLYPNSSPHLSILRRHCIEFLFFLFRLPLPPHPPSPSSPSCATLGSENWAEYFCS